MKYAKWITVCSLLLMWYALASMLQNEILLPLPQVVFMRMLQDLQDPLFYSTIAVTMIRMLKGLAVAFLLGIFLGMCSGISKWFEAFFYPIEVIVKTIPNISYIIISLIWLGSEKSVTVVSFLVLFPIVFGNTKQGIQSIAKEYLDVVRIFPVPFSYLVFHVYLPFLKPYLSAALHTALGLGFKVSVMAEILGRVQMGIGFWIDYCRVNLDYTGVFSWTIWIILLVVLLEKVSWIGWNRKKE
ncbi:MAG: ABC transporter permease subunit [Erysipelotrichaceae bacterium]|nr:ABC transporter permease subunit [Erysipelotrichaceae bacterium]